MYTVVLSIFFLTFLVISLIGFKKESTILSFVLADKNRSTTLLATSIFASVLGASATVGVVDLAYKVGVPAIWWLLSGSIGLIICGALLGEKIVANNCFTLTGLVELYFGAIPKKIVALIVYVGWIGVVAAQFIAAALLVSTLTNIPYKAVVIVISFYILLLCLIGGQKIILKSDFIQFFIIIIGLIGVALYLWIFKKDISSTTIPISFAPINENFKIESVLHYLVVVGSGFVIGPDIFSRLFSAKDKRVAKRAPIVAAICLFFINIFIVSIGLWAKKNALKIEGTNNTLYYIMNNYLPSLLKLILAITMLSTILSSANTCIISASTIFASDFLEQKKVATIRISAIALSTFAILIGLFNSNIISLLLISYSLFNIGVVPPLFVALLISPKRKIYPVAGVVALLCGASCGLLSNLLHKPLIALCGFILSFLLSAISYKTENLPLKE